LSSGWGTIKITEIRNRLSTEWKCGSGDYLFKWYSQTLNNNVSKENVPATARNMYFQVLASLSQGTLRFPDLCAGLGTPTVLLRAIASLLEMPREQGKSGSNQRLK